MEKIKYNCILDKAFEKDFNSLVMTLWLKDIKSISLKNLRRINFYFNKQFIRIATTIRSWIKSTRYAGET